MVFKRQEHDIILARFFINGDSSKAIRFIKRRGKFFRVDDVHTYYPKRSTVERTVEVTSQEIVTKILEALDATLRVNDTDIDETYEIWINDSIHKDLTGD